MERLLRKYWEVLTMVYRVGRYCITPSKGYRGVTQGESMLLTIFNMVVDTVIRHLVTVVVREDSGTKVLVCQ